MKKAIIILGILISFNYLLSGQTKSEKASIQVSAVVIENPPQIVFSWPFDPNATAYYIYKKDKEENNWGTVIASLPGSDTQFVDTYVNVGEAYEYKFRKSSSSGNAYNYIFAGIKYLAPEYHGTVLLLVDNTYSTTLSYEINRLIKDLISDGWQVIRHDVSRTDSVPDIKALIQNDYNNNPDVKTVFILGHVPVPYSGNFVVPPDGHDVNNGAHHGAWPADAYYVDMDGTWTDITANVTTPNREKNWNIPGDGKFDQSSIPRYGQQTGVEIQLGRVDVSNMPAFSLSDTELMKQYLDKDHNYRIGSLTAQRRGLISDNFKSFDEAFASNGWRNFSVMFGPSNITVIGSNEYFPTLKDSSYLWTYGCGAGSFKSASGIGTTSKFANDTVNSIFNMIFGSYFGDWDSDNNFLRAPLCSYPSGLVNFWAGRPHWHLHHMVLGENIGYSTMLSQNNVSNIYTAGFVAGGIHTALMGDPTLRMHVVKPPSNLKADSIENVTVKLNWSASSDIIVGYNIYRAGSIWGRFNRINSEPITDTTYIDYEADNGNNVYMIRAVKLETTGSGTYYNLSQGIIDSASTLWPQSVSDANNNKPLIKIYPNPNNGKFTIELDSENAQQLTITIVDLFGKTIYFDKIQNSIPDYTITVDLSGFPGGIYVLEAKSGEEFFYSKIICQ